jgi:hypothetical protein
MVENIGQQHLDGLCPILNCKILKEGNTYMKRDVKVISFWVRRDLLSPAAL